MNRKKHTFEIILKKVCLVGCIVHIRRFYQKAWNENKERAEHALKEIRQLYRIEKVAVELMKEQRGKPAGIAYRCDRQDSLLSEARE